MRDLHHARLGETQTVSLYIVRDVDRDRVRDREREYTHPWRPMSFVHVNELNNQILSNSDTTNLFRHRN